VGGWSLAKISKNKKVPGHFLLWVDGWVGPYSEKSFFSEITLEKCIRYFQKVPPPGFI